MSSDANEQSDGLAQQLNALLERARAGEGEVRVLVRDDPRWDGCYLPVEAYWSNARQSVVFLDCTRVVHVEGGRSKLYVQRVGVSLSASLVRGEVCPGTRNAGPGVVGQCLEGRSFHAVLVEREANSPDRPATRLVDLCIDMRDRLHAKDKTGAVSMVERFGEEALAQLLVGNWSGRKLFTERELFDLCRQYPMCNPIVSFFTGYAAVQLGATIKEAIRHLKFSARGGLKEACGLLGVLYRDGVDGELAPNLAEALRWFGRIGRNDPADPAGRFFFLKAESSGWPFSVESGEWRWEVVCDLLEPLSGTWAAEAALNAIPRSRDHVQRRWVVLDETKKQSRARAPGKAKATLASTGVRSGLNVG